jgi:hypothetical protein
MIYLFETHPVIVELLHDNQISLKDHLIVSDAWYLLFEYLMTNDSFLKYILQI